MQFIQFTAARADTGAVLPFAAVTVYLTGTATKAALFDNSGAGITNPFTASSVGLASCAAADGKYDIQVVSADGGYSAPKMVGVQFTDTVALAAAVAAALAIVRPATLTSTFAAIPPASFDAGALAIVTDANPVSQLAFVDGGTPPRWRFAATPANELTRVPVTAPIATAAAAPTLNAPYNAFGGTPLAFNSRSRHRAADAISAMAIVLSNWAVSTLNAAPLTEEGSGNDVTYTATVEYPSGTIIGRIKWSSATSVTIPSGGQVTSDLVTLSATIPKGAYFFIRMYMINAAAFAAGSSGTMKLPVQQFNQTGNGEALESVDSTDITGSGGAFLHNNLAPYRVSPSAIIGTTGVRSFALIGDSRTIGTQDTGTDSTPDRGEVARAIGAAGYAYINLGVGSDLASTFIASHANRLALAQLCTDIVIAYGVNDIGGGASSSTLLASLATIRDYFPGKRLYHYTLPPFGVSSSDGWTTLANQTPHSTWNPQRVALNTSFRAGIAGSITSQAPWIWEIADVMENGRNGGKWRVDLGAMTADSIHENTLANQTIAASGNVKL